MNYFSLFVFCLFSLAGQAQPRPLGPTEGYEAGIKTFFYRYDEFPDFIETESKEGFGLHGALTFQDTFNMFDFARLEASYRNAEVDYFSKGSGTLDNIPNDYYELRGLYGQTLGDEFSAISPYVGLAYRKLTSNSEGLQASSGAYGYLRESQYLYVPLGIEGRMKLGQSGNGLKMQAEYGHLLKGTQKSYIDGVIENQQHGGFHLRANLEYETPNWRIGPYYEHWSIDDSTINCNASGTFCGLEPRNITREVGLQATYKFGSQKAKKPHQKRTYR